MRLVLTLLAWIVAGLLASTPSTAQTRFVPCYISITGTAVSCVDTSTTNPLPVTNLGGGTVSSGTSQYFSAADATLTRPNNATPYAAGVAVGSGASTLFTFTNVLRVNGGTGFLTGLRMEASVASIAAANMGNIVCRIYNATPTAPAADQAAAPSLVANSPMELGAVDFSVWSIGGTGSDVIRSYGVPRMAPFTLKAAAASRNLYSSCAATGAFTPTANAIMNLYLGASLD